MTHNWKWQTMGNDIQWEMPYNGWPTLDDIQWMMIDNGWWQIFCDILAFRFDTNPILDVSSNLPVNCLFMVRFSKSKLLHNYWRTRYDYQYIYQYITILSWQDREQKMANDANTIRMFVVTSKMKLYYIVLLRVTRQW